MSATRDERGAAAVEFALIFSFVLGPLLFGIIAFGAVLFEQATVTQLARVAARSAAICSAGSGATAASCNSAGAGAASTYAPFATFPNYFVGGTPVVDTSTCFGGTSGSATATVQASPLIGAGLLATLFGFTAVTGKSATPCGG